MELDVIRHGPDGRRIHQRTVLAHRVPLGGQLAGSHDSEAEPLMLAASHRLNEDHE
jgi:hypothetical protein